MWVCVQRQLLQTLHGNVGSPCATPRVWTLGAQAVEEDEDFQEEDYEEEGPSREAEREEDESSEDDDFDPDAEDDEDGALRSMYACQCWHLPQVHLACMHDICSIDCKEFCSTSSWCLASGSCLKCFTWTFRLGPYCLQSDVVCCRGRCHAGRVPQ